MYYPVYLGFCSTLEDQICNGASLHVAYPILSMPYLLMPWWLKEPRHQQAWYWPNKPEYSVFSIRRGYNFADHNHLKCNGCRDLWRYRMMAFGVCNWLGYNSGDTCPMHFDSVLSFLAVILLHCCHIHVTLLQQLCYIVAGFILHCCSFHVTMDLSFS